MTGIKRARDNLCPLCDSEIKMFDLNASTSFPMCENTECVYPFDQPNVGGRMIELPHDNLRYSKKQRTHYSSLANTPLSQASDDDNSVISFEEFSLDDFNTGFLSMQTNDLTPIEITEDMLLGDESANTSPVLPDYSSTTTNEPASSSSLSHEDIDFLLTGNIYPTTSFGCLSPTSPIVNTPKDDTNLNWIEDLDFLFADDIIKSGFNPFDGDTELDSVLGI
ncbi:unnamed protein product [Mucor hiemalis]